MKVKLLHYRKLIGVHTLWFAIILLVSCEGKKNEVTNWKQFDSLMTKEENRPIDLDSVKLNIDNHQPLFLSYWVGMDEKQIEDVTRYLIYKGKIQINGYDRSKKIQGYEIGKKDIYYTLHLDTRDIKMTMSFDLFEPSKTLRSIMLSIDGSVNKHITFDEFNDLISLYKNKYGNPTSTDGFSGRQEGTLPRGFKICRFQNDLVAVSLNFYDRSGEQNERYGTSSLVISYNSRGTLEKEEKTRKEDEVYQKKIDEINKKAQLNDL